MGVYFKNQTNQGLALLSKILANKGQPNFFKAECGSGKVSNPDDIKDLLTLVDMQHEMTVRKAFSDNATVKINLMLDNINIKTGFELTEIGLFIRDDTTGEEALFSYAYFEKSDFIPVGDVIRKYFNYNIDTLISSEANITVVTDSSVYVTVQDLLEHDNNPNAHGGALLEATRYPIDATIAHNLDLYPDVLAIEFIAAYGVCGYGDLAYSGSNGKKLTSAVEYLDRDRIKIALNKQYPAVEKIYQLSETEFIITFDSCNESLYIVLISGIPINLNGGSSSISNTANKINYSNIKYPNIQNVGDGLDTALSAVKGLNWNAENT